MTLTDNPVRHYPWKYRIVFAIMEWLGLGLIWLGRRPHHLDSTRKILILEPFNLGDAVSLGTMFSPLKLRFPEAELHLWVKRCGAEYYASESRINKIFEVNFPWTGANGTTFGWGAFLKQVRQLRKERYDIGIDTRGEPRTQILLLLAGCRRRLGHTNYMCSNVQLHGFLLTDSTGKLPAIPRSQMNSEILKTIGCRVEQPMMIATPGKHPPGYHPRVVIHPGGGWKYKLWPTDRWIRFLNHLVERNSYDLLLIGAPGDKVHIDSILSQLQHPLPTQLTTLLELKSVISRSDLFICLDSGPMHIASSLGKPALALFGPAAIPVWRPIAPGSRVVHRQDDYPCAPCLSLMCIHPEFNCMAAITVDMVMGAFDAMLIDLGLHNSSEPKIRVSI